MIMSVFEYRVTECQKQHPSHSVGFPAGLPGRRVPFFTMDRVGTALNRYTPIDVKRSFEDDIATSI